MEHQRKLRRILEDFNDKTFLYSLLLNKAQSYYGRLKTLYKIPIIITSSVLSVVNSTNFDDETAIKYVNVSFNLLTALMLSLGGALNLEQKYSNFLNCEKKFLKLCSIIEQKILEDDDVDSDFVKNITSQYESILEMIDYDIPSFILKQCHKEYAGKKTLPLICNGVAKLEQARSPNTRSISYMDIKKMEKNNNYGILDLKSKIIHEDIIEKNKLSPIISPNSSFDVPVVVPQFPRVLKSIPFEECV